MVDPVKPSDDSDLHASGGASAHKHKTPSIEYEKISAKPMTFLGMHFTGPEAEKLWDVLIQQINSQIQHEQARALKALRKLRKDSGGGQD